MATLEEGQEYGLASADISRDNITVVHFKLTDSALKALEDFYKVRNNHDQRTNIQFKENQGVINIPSHGNRPNRSYKFSLSALPEVNGSFDCVQQTYRQGFSSLQSLGSMQHKVAVHATDDIYDSTRAKMNLAEEESKKVCTKEIKPSGRNISKKVKKIIPRVFTNTTAAIKPTHLVRPVPVHGSGLGQRQQHHQSNGSPASNSPHLSSSALSSSSKSQQPHSSPSYPSTKPASSFSSLKPASSIKSTPSSFSSTKPASTSVSSTSSSQQAGFSRQSPTPSLTTPTTTTSSKSGGGGPTTANSQNGVLTSSSSKPSSGTINMPYRDRIIHLLALKPYKKPELILRLQKDGIREKDRNSLGSILQQVATLNKDNSYTLARSAWIDVRQDWPFYTDVDRALLKKNLQLDTRPLATSPAVSPASSNPESPGSSQKRVAEEVEETAPMPKKKRISHLDRASNKSEDRQVSAVKPIVTQQASPNSNRENLDGNVENDADHPDYCRLFVRIEDRGQRQKYKHEFNKEYNEYRGLHQQVEQVARRFQELFSKINETEEGSDDFEVLKLQAIQEAEAQRSDPKFMGKKRRMEYLHQKLGHIKRLIHDFDNQDVGCDR